MLLIYTVSQRICTQGVQATILVSGDPGVSGSPLVSRWEGFSLSGPE